MFEIYHTFVSDRMRPLICASAKSVWELLDGKGDANHNSLSSKGKSNMEKTLSS